MVKRLPLPHSIQVFHAMMGVLEFSIFNENLGNNCSMETAISEHLKYCIDRRSWLPKPIVVKEYFQNHKPKMKSKDDFLGLYYNFSSKSFGWPKNFQISEFPLDFSQGDKLGFSYFFARPVYGPVKYGTNNRHPDLGEWEAAYEAVLSDILPEGLETEIYDWCHADLEQLSYYFSGGLEFGLANLYLLYTPDIKQIIVISESNWN